MRTLTRALLAGSALACLLLFLAGAAPAAEEPAEEPAKFGLESVGATTTTSQAGAHPDVTLSFSLRTDPDSSEVLGLHKPYAFSKNLNFALPPGMLGNLNAVDQCSFDQFMNAFQDGGCPLSSQV